jgi:ABC-type lipoprotein release transport system permease subunit
VTPGFFKTMEIPHVAGRDFSESDTVSSVPVAIVGEELVRQQFPDGSPIGRRLRINVDRDDFVLPTALILLAVASLASFVPARRGMQMAPNDALRTN